MLENRDKKRAQEAAAGPSDPDFSYTSRTRSVEFQFERDRAPYFGWTKCTYKVQQFSYRRIFEAGLRGRRRRVA